MTQTLSGDLAAPLPPSATTLSQSILDRVAALLTAGGGGSHSERG